MANSIYIYLFIFVVLLAVLLTYFKIADKFNIIDRPNERSSHNQITLRGGGIIFYVGTLLWFLCFNFQYPYFIAGLTLIVAISFLDDIHPLPARIRLLFHITAMLLMFYQWGLFEIPWYYTVLALICCTGVINAYNFMDGINGITGGYSLVVVGSLWYINNYQYPFVDNDLIYVMLLSLLVFNFFNFRKKAKCFAGDVGSVGMAFIVLFMLGQLIVNTGNFSYLVILSVYGVDSVLTIIHRLLLKENIFKAHRKHVFQLLANELKFPHVKVTLFYMGLQTIIFIGYICFHKFGYWYFLGVVMMLSVGYVTFIKKYFHLHKG